MDCTNFIVTGSQQYKWIDIKLTVAVMEIIQILDFSLTVMLLKHNVFHQMLKQDFL